MELLESSAMTGGARVRARIVFSSRGSFSAAHIHLRQDETFEVLSGELTYTLGKTKRVARPGETVTLPRGIPHRHYADGREDAVVIATMTPGLDFDYLLENIFGRAAAGEPPQGFRHKIQALVWQDKLESNFTLPDLPVWVQRAAARIVTPIAYLFGYRAVYQQFSGQEW